MIEWNRDVASAIQLLLVLLFFILLVIFRKRLGRGIIYLILASAIVAGTDSFVFFMRMKSATFNSIAIYSIAVNLFVFLLFFIYFYHVLELKKSKKLSLFLLGSFLTTYIFFAIFSEDFYSKFPFIFYFVEVILLMGNIYLVMHEVFNSDKILNIKRYYPIWACVGIMSVYLGVTPLLIISNSVEKLMNIKIFFIILFIVNMIGYSILITGIFFAQNIKKGEPYRN